MRPSSSPSPVRARRAALAAALVATTTAMLAVPTTAQAAPPDNDDFADAQRLPAGFGNAAGVNREATRESGEPEHGGVLGNKSVWFSWTAPRTGLAQLDTFSGFDFVGTDFDTVVAVYTGSDLEDLTPVASNDDAFAFFPLSRVRFRATAGTTYRIAVDGVAGKSGNYRLHYVVGRPPNDNFEASQQLSGRAGRSTPVDNTLATRQAGEPPRLTNSVWYRWRAPATGRAVVTTVGSNYDTYLWVFRGRQLDGLTLIGSNDDAIALQSRVAFNARAGQVYRVAVTSLGRDAPTGTSVVRWRMP
jgi:hypothetical protein